MRKLVLVVLLVAVVLLAIEVIDRIPSPPDPRAATGPRDDDRMVLTFGEEPGAGGRVEGVDYHVVAEGETLEVIAAHYFGDPSAAGELAAFNGLIPPYELVAGQVLDLR